MLNAKIFGDMFDKKKNINTNQIIFHVKKWTTNVHPTSEH